MKFQHGLIYNCSGSLKFPWILLLGLLQLETNSHQFFYKYYQWAASARKHVKNGFLFPYPLKANSGPLAFCIYQLVSAAMMPPNNQVKVQWHKAISTCVSGSWLGGSADVS